MSEPTKRSFLITASCRSEFQTAVLADNAEEAARLALEVPTENWEFLGTDNTTIRPMAITEVNEVVLAEPRQ